MDCEVDVAVSDLSWEGFRVYEGLEGHLAFVAAFSTWERLEASVSHTAQGPEQWTVMVVEEYTPRCVSTGKTGSKTSDVLQFTVRDRKIAKLKTWFGDPGALAAMVPRPTKPQPQHVPARQPHTPEPNQPINSPGQFEPATAPVDSEHAHPVPETSEEFTCGISINIE